MSITSGDVPKRLPLSPDTVYQYINGSARFWGFDITSAYNIIPELQLNAGFSYLWGQDIKLKEPALGVAPLRGDVGLRYESNQWPLFVESTVYFTDDQTRVATARGETPTDGYVTADLQTGTTLWNRVSVQAGVRNLMDRRYVNHLNAKPLYRNADSRTRPGYFW